MEFYIVIFFVCENFLHISDVRGNYLRPRGVSIAETSLYDPSEEFICLDGSKTLPFNYVNDDYCDCPDGSDEPGTSACSDGKFFCNNFGYKSRLISSSWVNDGICDTILDCCDTSDEYNLNTSCSNNCKELGQKAYEEAKRLAEIQEIGYKLKLEYCENGSKIIKEKQDELEKLTLDKDVALALKLERQREVNETEAAEHEALDRHRIIEEQKQREIEEIERHKERNDAIEIFNRIDENKDGILHQSELQKQKLLDQNKDGDVSEEEAKFFLSNQNEMRFDDFLVTSWPLIKSYLKEEKNASDITVPLENMLVNKLNSELKDDELDENYEEENEEEIKEDEGTAEIKPTEDSISERILQPMYDNETQMLINNANVAREKLENASHILMGIENKIKDIHQFLETDMGEKNQFVPLYDLCFQYTDQDYTYKFCPFHQVPQDGGEETRLGSWTGWKGTSSDKYSSMIFEHGSSCWNGPQRSVEVNLICGMENAIISVAEPSRCEYVFQFSTPAHCPPPESFMDKLHDEL